VRALADDEGSASLEFVTVGMILLVPLVYLVLVMSAIQGGALAAEGAARHAARVFVQSETVTSAQARAATAIEFALADHGVDPDGARVAISCSPVPASCLTRHGFVTVVVELTIPLPLVPPVLSGSFPVAVPLRATATEQVSRFWGAG
jgi:hypothetical protein